MRQGVSYSKVQRRQLRELLEKAYRTELEKELAKLFRKFQQWQVGDISAWDLEAAIHNFANRTARKLYNRYNDVEEDLVVTRALR